MPRWQQTLLLLSALTCLARGANADEKPILSAGTEVETPGEARPSEALTRVVLRSLDHDDIAQLDNCLEEQGLKRGDYAALLSAVRVELGEGHSEWFVRPAHKPYCFALYGAHLFRYFWVEETVKSARPRYRIRFQTGGDFFTVFPVRSRGLNDIEATGCIAVECSSVRMAFDGREYRAIACSVTTWDDNDREVRTPRACGSDGGPDGQSSGFWRRR